MVVSTRSLKFFLSSYSLMLIVACGGGGDSDSGESATQNASQAPTQTPAASAEITQTQAMEAVYRDVRTPNEFYREPQRDPGMFYLIKHVKSSILNLANDSEIQSDTKTTDFELCTNDFNTALNWSEQDNELSNVYRNLVGNTENEMFFEFTRVSSSQPTIVQFNRIYKCSNLNRDPALFSQQENIIGLYNNAQGTAEQFKKLIEYLWFVSPKNNYGYSVLDSTVLDMGDSYKSIIKSAHLTINGSVNQQCDLIDIELFEYVADKGTGIITLSIRLQSSFYAKYINNIVQACTDPQQI